MIETIAIVLLVGLAFLSGGLLIRLFELKRERDLWMAQAYIIARALADSNQRDRWPSEIEVGQ